MARAILFLLLFPMVPPPGPPPGPEAQVVAQPCDQEMLAIESLRDRAAS